MTEDVVSVQPETTSKGVDSKQEPAGKEPAPQPSQDEIISKRVQEILSTETEKFKRELQSAKDKHKAEIEKTQREARYSQETLNQFRGSLGEIDPDTATKLELAEYRAKERAAQATAQEQSYTQQAQTLVNDFDSAMTQHITEVGIDPTDKRIDWGTDSQTLLEKQKKILASVAKIQKANLKAAEEAQVETFKKLKADLRKEFGLDSVDTSNPTGSTKDKSKYTADDWINDGLKEAKKKR